jgi:type IV pilus assembly protein PilV
MPTMNRHSLKSRHQVIQQQGGSLLEVLITVLIVSFGLLSMAGMQAYSVAVNASSTNRAVAVAMATDYADMARANATAFAAGWYDRAANFNGSNRTVTALPANQICAFPACTVTTLADYERNMTLARMKAALPAGDFVMARVVTGGLVSTRQADLWVMWLEQELNTDKDAVGASKEKSQDNCPQHVRTLNPLPRCFYMRVSL